MLKRLRGTSVRGPVPLGLLMVLLSLPVSHAHGAPGAEPGGRWRDAGHIWRASCSYCHDAGVAPALKGRPWPVPVLLFWLRRGPGAMPSFTAAEVSDADVRALAQWLDQQPAATSAHDAKARR